VADRLAGLVAEVFELVLSIDTLRTLLFGDMAGLVAEDFELVQSIDCVFDGTRLDFLGTKWRVVYLYEASVAGRNRMYFLEPRFNEPWPLRFEYSDFFGSCLAELRLVQLRTCSYGLCRAPRPTA
jgi:hypothetical protein